MAFKGPPDREVPDHHPRPHGPRMILSLRSLRSLRINPVCNVCFLKINQKLIASDANERFDKWKDCCLDELFRPFASWLFKEVVENEEGRIGAVCRINNNVIPFYEKRGCDRYNMKAVRSFILKTFEDPHAQALFKASLAQLLPSHDVSPNWPRSQTMV